MTDHALCSMRLCTDVPFRFVIMETLDEQNRPSLLSGAVGMWKNGHDVHEIVPHPHTIVEKLNLGLRQCTADYVVHTANDIFVRPGWLEALLEVFTKYPDAGVATLASSDIKGPQGTQADVIREGIYGPHMMFRRQWDVGANVPSSNRRVQPVDEIRVTGTLSPDKQFDPRYHSLMSDTDLIMAHYAAGLVSYRNYRVVIDHLNRATMDGLYSKEDQEKRLKEADAYFRRKFDSLLVHRVVYGLIAQGMIV